MGTSRSVRAAEQNGPDPRAVLETALGEQGIRLDLARGLCAAPASVLVRTELLEYLLVGTGGSAHESLFVTDVSPSLLNTAFLALGLAPGTNAVWIDRDPRPSPQEIRAGVAPFEIFLPTGDGLFVYALWKEAGEVYFHRVEDLLRNLGSGRAMKRHQWVYLGSRFAVLKDGEPEVFVAERQQNLINIAFFRAGNTLLTSALEESLEQTIWIANSWLLPDRGWPVQLIFSRHRLDGPPGDWLSALVDDDPEQEGQER